jgi:hypothetical protein
LEREVGMVAIKNKPVFRYRIHWQGPFDAATCPVRILRSWAQNKAQALAQHQALYPVKWVKVERISKEIGRG